MKIFQKYSNYYDSLYRDKDYAKETSFLEKIFRKYSRRTVHSVLDLGCGIGGHSLILGERGYRSTGIDLSFGMIKIAERKAREKKIKVDFVQGDIRKINLKKKFDAVISMFAVISYQATNEDLFSAISVAENHLKKDGLFIFDCWFGPAVLYQRPSKKKKIVKSGNEKIIRFAEPILDIFNQTVDIRFKIIRTSAGKVLDKAQEVHRVRFLFPQEVKFYLEKAGFNVLEICPFMKLKKIPTENDWNITVIAQKL